MIYIKYALLQREKDRSTRIHSQYLTFEQFCIEITTNIDANIEFKKLINKR